MRFSRLLVVLALTISFVAVASEPGQPLDCSDWVFLEPGLSCRIVLEEEDCGSLYPAELCFNWPGRPADNAGGVLWIRQRPGNYGYCPGGGSLSYRVEISRLVNGVWSVIAFVEERCGLPGFVDEVRLSNSQEGHAGFEGNYGRLLLGISTRTWPSLNFRTQLVAIEGFATTFDILQTFTLSTNEIGFRVPYMPEGMGGADHFDTYYGNLTKPINFAQAQPLACGYPAAPPAVGDYMEVADTLADPAPGTGRYYVTATTYQGQTRYGRKTSGGRLSGRDPAPLPACIVQGGAN